eukprot:Skav208065  [mRNA]  locus=scaffold936:122039:130199:+ [translate_table: standard]
MTRNRSFILTGASLQPHKWTPQQVNWNDIGARMVEIATKHELALPLDTSTPLFLTRFLPFDKRMQAHSLNIANGPAVVQLRCHRGPVLPTLVASYRFQDKLDLTHLMKKGIFTWLVADDAFPFGVRFLHAFEAARCLGFQTDLRLPSDQSFAMQLLGNCVSPVQAIWALSQVLPTTCEPYEVACGWLFHQLPLHSLRVVVFEDDMLLVQSIPLGRPHFLKADVQMISCDGALFPVPSPLVHSRTRASCTLPLATPWTILELGRWLHEDTLLLIARVIPLQVIIGDVPILLSPFASLDVLAPFLKDHAPSHLETNPLWTWFTGDDPVFRWPDQQLVVDPPRVFLTAGTHVKAVPWVEGQTIAQCIANTFHYRHLRLAVAVSLEGLPIDTQSLVQPFQSIQCQFAPQQVFIEPYGAFTLDPMTRVSIVARMISDLRFGGRASVRLTCNGKLLSPELFIGYADSLGVLRAKVFALPGGAPSLAAQMENLQTLLVQHGHPASTSKAKSDEIFNKLGQTKLKVIAESKTPWIQLKAEASAHKIVLIPPEHRGQAKSSEDPLLANDPWLAGRNRDSKTAKKKQAPKPPPSKVDISFFHADGCPVAQIELPKLLQGSRGLVVTDLKSFRDHVDSALAANMTVGPSGVLLLGVVPSQIVSSPSARVQALAVPGWLGSSPTAFKATLIQTGDAPLSTRTLQELKLPEARQTHRVAQIHVFKDETDTWSTLVSQGIVSYLKSLGYPHFGSISQTWSLDFFHRGKKAEPEQASYYHGFLKLDATHFEQLLKLGGISGFYPNPRSESRGKHGYGVRVLAEDYSESRKKLFPQGVESSDSEPGGPRKFQLLGVPDSVNRSVLKQALAAMGWSARVSRTAGYRAWSVFASTDPPTRCFPLKDEMVMVVESSHSKVSGPILGTTSKHFRASTVHLGPLETQATSVCPQSVATKFEQLDSQATARVTTLEQKFEALAESVASSQVATSKSVNELAQSVSTLNNHVQEQARAYDQQLKTMFGQLAKKQDDGFEALERASELTLKGLRQDHQNAMKSMRQDFETSYKELRDIFTHSPKARKVTAESSDGQPGAAMAALSETSRSKRAVAAVLSEYRALGYRLSLSDPVPDRFQVVDDAGSYRGLSRGVAVASKFPIFSPRPSQVPLLAWQLQRLLCTVVQMGQVPLHIVTVYLHPNPTPGSFRHRLNSQLLDWAWAILSEVSGPACLVGDFNSPWEAYDVGETLAAKGWVDLHAFWAEQKGQDPQPTCKQATRHTFILGNPSFRPFVTDVTVDFEDSLDSHSVLLAKISCPTCNPLVWKWLLPQSLDQCSFDPLLAQETPDQDWLDEFQPLLQAGDLSKAFQHWSQSAEAVLVRAARLNDAPVPAGRFSGRAQQLHPVRRALAAPRFKQGRSSDFCVDHHANTLLVRQVQRQARRLQNLGRLLRSPVRPVTHNKISELWQAILASTGFGRSFPNWLLSQVDFIHLSPTVACVETVTQVVLAHANRLASQSWRARRKHFSDCLETSWTSDGGRLPFKMVREAPLPPVQELEMVIPLLLAPQRWSPIGKAWIPFVNADPIPIGAELTWVGGSCHVLDKVGNSLQVSVRLTRREASQLVYRKVSLDPNEWAPFFLTQWEQYWKRDQVDDVQASKAVFGSHKGSSPWLACLLGTYRCIDPQFILLMNRIALFRQMVKELPSQASFLTAQLARTGRYRGPTSRLVTVLGDLGWGHQAEGAFVDKSGRTFHLLLTPLPHVEALLLSSWTQEVARRTSHRKYLAALDTIDVSLSASFRHLPMSERTLLQRQHSGAFFTGEFLKHTGSTDQCRFCQQQDTRIHRLLHCPRIQSLLASFPLLVRNRDAIPLHTWAHGLWEEPPLWRPWQALLDSLTLPEIARSDCTSPVYLYSDGACLRPKCSHASLAAAAVVKAAADGTFEVVWSGRLPGSLQTPFRAELLAGAVAFASHQEVHFFSDCLAFVKVARRLLLAAQRGLDPVFPLTHLDLWTFFWVCLQGATVASCAITWVPSHKDYRKLSGIERVHAWFNGCVDKIARESARLAICPLFLDLVAQVDLLRQAATQLASFQAGVAKIFANERTETPDREPSLPGDLVPQAPVQVPSEVVLDFSSVPCPSFARQLLQWLLSLRWTPSAIDPASRQIWSDTSFLELFWAFVWSTGVLPPFRHDGAWVLPQDDPLLIFVQPSFCVLFRSWKRQLDILVRLGFIPCWASARSVTASAGSLGARFPCPGVDGRALVPFESLLSLAAALRCARRLSALALPITVN